MDALHYIATYGKREKSVGARPISINLITNFTDDVLEKVLGGMCIAHGLDPLITRAPYRQYALALKDPSSAIYLSKPDITFFFFDMNPQVLGEFSSARPEHIDDLYQDLKTYSETVGGTIIASTPLLPYTGALGLFFKEDPLFSLATAYIRKVEQLAGEMSNVHVFDTNRIAQRLGEDHIRDRRGALAFDMPFTTDFFVALCHEWFSYINAITGRARKCIVLDLDNTLWGGVVGEAGPLGIDLGPQYPGNAYLNFQRALLQMSQRGILLALNSKNNIADVEEVFEKNPHMILTKDHFAAIRANWEHKEENIRSIAAELNIGLDSLVFLDDSPLERDRVRQTLGEVLVPDMPAMPEDFAPMLFSLNVFHQMSLTAEDREKGKMYAQERDRKRALENSSSLEEYIADLHIEMNVVSGNEINLARAAQLTQKTNQFNLTTKRYDENDIRRMILHGDFVCTGEVRDRFGNYGIVILAIVTLKAGVAELDTFLMSCRVMGRGVERMFLEHILGELRRRNISKLSATFIPSRKNEPASLFLPGMGFSLIQENSDGSRTYALDVQVSSGVSS